MYVQVLDPRQISEYRTLLIARIAEVLRQNESSETTGDIESAVFRASQDRHPSEHLVDLVGMFNARTDQLDAAIALAQDAWNYFPHEDLDGRCPAEVMFERTRVSKARHPKVKSTRGSGDGSTNRSERRKSA